MFRYHLDVSMREFRLLKKDVCEGRLEPHTDLKCGARVGSLRAKTQWEHADAWFNWASFH